ncbi:hypothetical protein RUND412_005844 [Rhizina undulata]
MQFSLITLVAFIGLSSAAAITPRASLISLLTGDGTFYYPGLGACGVTNTASDLIVATNIAHFECGKQIQITRNGVSVTATIQDLCAGCSVDDVDMSPAVFTQLATEAEGRVSVTWKFV